MLQRMLLNVTAGSLFFIGLIGCSHPGSSSATASGQLSLYDINKYAVNKTVCNPLNPGGTAPTDPTAGIHASLYYLNPDQPRYSNVADIIHYGTKSKQDLFFTDIDVPTRLFTEGFPLQSGGLVQDDAGNTLLEYFALEFEGVVHLGPNDPEGDYQLGMLSDDGAVMSLSTDMEGDNYQVVVNDDGVHPTKMDCGPIVSLTKDTTFRMKIDYFQGPRYHISLIPLWRPVTASTPKETLCGVEGNSTFFDYNNNSAPEPDYNQLLARGWRPLGASNYTITPSTDYNPCVNGTNPVISNLSVTYNLEASELDVSWTTDIPASDQVLITDTTTGQQTLTPSDNLLRTQHLVKVTGAIFANIPYAIQAVSISSDLGKTVSDPVSYTLTLP